MTDSERDPVLQSFLAAANTELAGEDFAVAVLARIEKDRRRSVILWSCAGFAAVLCLWPLGVLARDFVHALTQFLTLSVFEMLPGPAGRALAPLHTVGGVAVITVIGIRTAFRRVFATVGSG